MHRPGPLLLDTHIWIWLMEGMEDKIPMPVRARIAAAAARGLVYIAPMSVWELGMLEAHGRLTLSVEINTWVNRALSAPGLQLAPFSPQIAIDSTRLPGVVHGDPADRMIIATARSLNGTIITRDHRILDYAQGGHVKTLNAEA